MIEFNCPTSFNDSKVFTRLGVQEPSSKSVDACVAALRIDVEVLEARKTLTGLARLAEQKAFRKPDWTIEDMSDWWMGVPAWRDGAIRKPIVSVSLFSYRTICNNTLQLESPSPKD